MSLPKSSTPNRLSMPSHPPVFVSRVFRVRILLLTGRDQVTERRGCWRCRNELWTAPSQPWMARLSRRDRGHCGASLTQQPAKALDRGFSVSKIMKKFRLLLFLENISRCLPLAKIYPLCLSAHIEGKL